MSKKNTRMVELDILRALAIIVVVFGHFGFFLPTVRFSMAFSDNVTAFGVALFLFISGYVMYMNHPSFTRRNDLTDYFKKRVLRIFPLYWLSLGLRFAIGTTNYSQINNLILVLGLQGFLSPRVGTDSVTGWWFIGVILVLYTIYPLIAVLASDTLKLPTALASDTWRFAIILIVPFLVLVLARSALFIIADSVFVFFGIFVLGVAISKYNVLSKYGLLTDDKTRLFKHVVVWAVSLTAAVFIYGILNLVGNANLSALSRFAAYSNYVVMNAVFVLFALLTFCLARIFMVSSSQASRPLFYAAWYRVFLILSFSSYAIYLFFVPILTQFENILTAAQLTGLEIDIILILVGLPAVVIVAYLLQRTQNEILSRIRTYRESSV